jgi:hypothetical protein
MVSTSPQTTCQIGISMATKGLTWGILTSGLVSMFFYRHVAPDANGAPHHILSFSELVYIDATGPSLISLCAATLLGAQDPHTGTLIPRPVSVKITLRPYPIPQTASASNATRHRGNRNYRRPAARLSSSAQNPRGSTSREVFPHARQPLQLLPRVRKVLTLEHRVGVRRQCLWKVFLFSSSSSYHHI